MLAALAGALQEAGHSAAAPDVPALAASLCLAVNVAHKTFAAHVGELSTLREWRSIWLSTVQAR